MSRLPAWSYSGADPDGYLAAPELVSNLPGYAGSFAAPLHEGTTVERVDPCAGAMRVVTDRGVTSELRMQAIDACPSVRAA